MEKINNMLQADYMFAGIAMRICSLHEGVHIMCADYKTSLEPALTITSSEEEIREERHRNDADGDDRFPDDYIETLVIYRKMAVMLVEHNVLLIHGSAIAVDGQGYLFTALSGTGKSTHTRLWHEVFGDRVTMINDDKPLVRIGDDGKVTIYGTPWDGKHHLSNNISVPLKSIVYLERGEQNEIHGVSAGEMFPILLQQTFRENNAAMTAKVLALISRLTQAVTFFDLHCTISKEAAKVAFEGVTEYSANVKKLLSIPKNTIQQSDIDADARLQNILER